MEIGRELDPWKREKNNPSRPRLKKRMGGTCGAKRTTGAKSDAAEKKRPFLFQEFDGEKKKGFSDTSRPNGIHSK